MSNVRTINLKNACRALERSADKETRWRPAFHLSPMTGWLNDPNGLCQIGATHHVFFQYSPFDVKPGLNYWGHYTTEDFVTYQYHEPGLCSDEKFDCHGVYSGSALEADDTLYVFYTGNVLQRDDPDYDYITRGREHNTIRAESKDGIHFEKKEVLLYNRDYPADVTCHVRDPKVWKDGDSYTMVLGSRRKDDVGEILVYRSSDLKDWKLANRVTSETPFGYMWECPDCFTLDGVRFLSFSPQGVDAQDWKYNNIYQSGYCRLEGDLYGDYELKPFREFDHGFDFYAPQTYLDQQGRRILIGWMGMPDCDYGYPEREYGWTNLLTIPRVLHQRDGRIFQEPLPELQKLRGEELHMTVQDSAEQKTDFVYEAEILNTAGEELEVQFGTDGSITWKGGLLSLGFGERGQNRPLRRVPLEKLENLRIFCDTSSIELFANDGEAVFTSRFYADAAASQLTVLSAQAEVTLWKLHPIQIENCFSNKEA